MLGGGWGAGLKLCGIVGLPPFAAARRGWGGIGRLGQAAGGRAVIHAAVLLHAAQLFTLVLHVHSSGLTVKA